MTELDPSYIPHLPPGTVHQREGDLHLLLHPEKPRWAVANQLGWEIVQLCDGNNTVESITSTIAERYGMPYQRVEEDVLKFMESLVVARLLASEERAGDIHSPSVEIKSIFLHLTNRCNLKCIHCYAAGDVQSGEELKSQKIYHIIDELARRGGRAITFSGGEPLLRRDWSDILTYAGDTVNVTLNTNGTLIDESSAVLLSRLSPTIQVSLDGPSPEVHDAIRGPGSFGAAVKGIRRLQNNGLTDNLIICMTLMKNNIAWAPAMIPFVRQLGVPTLRFLPLHSQGRARASWSTLDASLDDYQKWFNHVYQYGCAGQPDPGGEIRGGLPGFLLYMPSDEDEPWCGVGRKIVVDPYGDVYPCSLLMDDDFHIGNVNQMSLEEIETSPKLKELTEACRSRKDAIEACRKCAWRNFCQASCPAFAYLERGTLWATDHYCDVRQRLYEDMIIEIARRKQDAVSS